MSSSVISVTRAKFKSIEEAVDWLKRAPFDGGAEVEIRPLFEAEDFPK